jgi:hypothetical protein
MNFLNKTNRLNFDKKSQTNYKFERTKYFALGMFFYICRPCLKNPVKLMKQVIRSFRKSQR